MLQSFLVQIFFEKSSTAPQMFGRTWPFEYLQHHNITSVAGCSTVPTAKVGLAIQFLPKHRETRAIETNYCTSSFLDAVRAVSGSMVFDCLALLPTRARPRLTTSSTISIRAAEVACSDFAAIHQNPPKCQFFSDHMCIYSIVWGFPQIVIPKIHGL